MHPGNIVSTCCYGFGVVICIWYIVHQRFVLKSMPLLSSRALYSMSLTVCFIIRMVTFCISDYLIANFRSFLLILLGFIFLVYAKCVALGIWYECGIAFIAVTKSSFQFRVRLFRRTVIAILVFITAQFVALFAWAMADSKMDFESSVFEDMAKQELFLSCRVALYWFGSVNIFLASSSMLLGFRLYIHTRNHAHQDNPKIRKLSILSWAAAAICMSFMCRSVFDTLTAVSPSFDKFCFVDKVNECMTTFFISTEFVPNLVMQVVLFLLSQRKKRNSLKKSELSDVLQVQQACP